MTPWYKDKFLFVILAVCFGGNFWLMTFSFATENWHTCEDKQNRKERDACYLKAALQKGELGFCRSITDPDILEDCQRQVSVPHEAPEVYDCHWDDGSLKQKECVKKRKNDTSFSQQAIERRDVTFCLQIKDPYSLADCYRQIAAINNNLSICNQIEEEHTLKNRCYAQLAYIRNDPSVCEKRDGQLHQEWCYLWYVRYQPDLTICEKVKVERESCYFNIALANRNLEICRRIQNFSRKDGCLWRVNYFINDISVCEQIKKIIYKDSCYSNLAVSTRDLSLCDKVEGLGMGTFVDPVTRDTCYVDVAEAKNYIGICDKITDEFLKNKCLDIVKTNIKNGEGNSGQSPQ